MTSHPPDDPRFGDHARRIFDLEQQMTRIASQQLAHEQVCGARYKALEDKVDTGITVTLTGTPAFSAFASAASTGLINPASNVTFSGSATGARYAISSNGTINTNGGGASFLPGNSAGSGSGYF